MPTEASSLATTVGEFARENKLRALGAFWALGIASALAMEHRARRASAMSVKLIHSRLYAQAATLAALGAAASLEMRGGRDVAANARDPHEYRAPKTSTERRRGETRAAADG